MMKIEATNLADPGHCKAMTDLLNEYASNPSGGSTPIDANALEQLPSLLRDCPTYLGLLAYEEQTPVGLLNAFWSVSTFKARRLMNIHDIAVSPSHQRGGVGIALLQAIERKAADLQCCKITLEVLEENQPAIALYQRTGFENYQLDPTFGDARLMQKWLL